jgi:hypothetical protein
LALHGRNERRALEQGSRESFNGAMKRFCIFNGRVEAYDADVFFTGTLLRLDETGGSIDAYNETSCYLGIKGTGVTSLFNT